MRIRKYKEYTPNKSADDIMKDMDLLRRVNKPKNLNYKRRFHFDFGGVFADVALATVIFTWVGIIIWATWSIFNR